MSIYSQCLQVADSFGPVNDEKFLDQVLQCRELLNIAHSLHPPKTLNILNIKTVIDQVLQWRTLKITRPCRNLWNSWTIIQLYVYHIGAMSFADLLRFSFWFLSFNSSVLPDLFNSSMLCQTFWIKWCWRFSGLCPTFCLFPIRTGSLLVSLSWPLITSHPTNDPFLTLSNQPYFKDPLI